MARRVRAFWNRISNGAGLEQLWSQFHAEARASYQTYSEEVEWTRREDESHPKRFFRVIRGLFWAMIMKLSPSRRVLFVAALVLIWLPEFRFQNGNTSFQTPSGTFLGALALVVLLALELADRVAMKRDLEIARDIQKWLMPEAPPSVPGFDIAFATRPANTVAGDYYDAFFRSAAGAGQSDGRLLLIVADVAGKSMPAALLMATLQASLRTLAALPGSLLELVARLNQYACAQNLGGHRFTTAFLAELDHATGRLEYVNAGHNWPILQRTSGAVDRLETGGLPLGIRPQAQYVAGETTLGAGDLLLIFTDGLVEAEDAQQREYGEPRVFDVTGALSGLTAAESLRRVMSSVDAFVGPTRQHDDITCLVLRRLTA